MNLAWPALGWSALLVVAFAGWGGFFLRAVLPAVRPGWGLAGSLGMAVTAVLGGIANLARMVSAPAVIGYVIAGAIAWGWLLYRDHAARRDAWSRAWRMLRGDWVLALLVAALLALVAVRFVSAPVRSSYVTNYAPLRGMSFNMHDDMHAYLVFPEKLLQTGHLAPDPFNARQMETSLGAAPLLTALARAALPIQHLHVMEESVCLLLLVGLLAEMLGALAAPPPPRVRVLLLVLVLGTLTGNLNLSSYLSSAALVGALAWLFAERCPADFLSPRWAVVLGVVLAAVAALKTTMIPLAGLFAGGVLLVRLVTHFDRRVFTAVALAGLVALGGLLPWMIEMNRGYGTPLFPFLGRGIHYTAIAAPVTEPGNTVWATFWFENKVWPYTAGVVVVLLGGLAVVPATRRRVSPPLWALAGSLAVAWPGGATALSLAGGGIDATRYVQPLMLVGVPLWFTVGWNLARTPAGRRARHLAVVLWFAFVAGWIARYHRPAWHEYVQAVRDDLNPTVPRLAMATPELSVQAQRIQNAVPPGEKLLVRLTHPFLLDFRRNPVFIADWPGAVSPPPGLPVYANAEAQAKYLLGQGIRYVAYAYRLEANFSVPDYGWMAAPQTVHWNREVARRAFAFQANLAELGLTRRRVYTDPYVWVIDLASYSGRLPPLQLR